ncbi:hypothetical protein MAQ5080_02634 [Marinomonas aquimarina]|uniref:Uncharacterized protein n=1 Tax=Marinomonas aquimarina TaxID=295068 RepID=A0A1A8TIV3_9GAMM|nr:DUF2057 family protein [Marinomonas aquimarina]SBS33641.1 hypothetical protein MAQ5080_02634 [Marinomonas aquimarina]
MSLRSSVVMGMLLATSSLPAFAASFEVPRNFEIMYLNLEDPGRFGGDFETEVAAGEHQFVVRFNQRVGGGSNAEQFQSEPFIIDIKLAEDAEIVLQAPYFFRKNDAAKFAKQPEFSLLNKTTDAKPDYEVRMLPKQSGVQIMRDYKREVKDFTATYKQPVVDSPVPAAASATATEELEMLKFWYNKADASTRKDIRIWMVDSSHQAKAPSTAYDMLGFWFNKASKEDQKAFQIWLLNE